MVPTRTMIIAFVGGSVAREKNARVLAAHHNLELFAPAPPISMLTFIAEGPETKSSVFFTTPPSPRKLQPNIEIGGAGES